MALPPLAQQFSTTATPAPGRRLETSLVAAVGVWYSWHLVGGGPHAAELPTVHRTAPQQRVLQHPMSIGLRLETALASPECLSFTAEDLRTLPAAVSN